MLDSLVRVSRRVAHGHLDASVLGTSIPTPPARSRLRTEHCVQSSTRDAAPDSSWLAPRGRCRNDHLSPRSHDEPSANGSITLRPKTELPSPHAPYRPSRTDADAHAGRVHHSSPTDATACGPFGSAKRRLDKTSRLNHQRTLLAERVSLSTVSRAFNSLFKVLFIFPSRYLFAIGLVAIFSFRWSLPPILGCIPKQPDSSKVHRSGGPTNHRRDSHPL